ncbi:MAG: hypothetical protein LBB78_10560 [Spirochaetaceae bacterium]|nr:hypothetical protein [Spirochaetaceae bacterium]
MNTIEYAMAGTKELECTILQIDPRGSEELADNFILKKNICYRRGPQRVYGKSVCHAPDAPGF